MSGAVYRSPGPHADDKPWVSVLTTPLGGGAFLLCIHTPEKHEVRWLPRRLFGHEQAAWVGQLMARHIGALADDPGSG